MENTLYRNRTTRNNYRTRRRQNIDVDRSSKIIKQLIISITVFVVLLTAKNIDSNPTNFFKQKMSVVLNQDTDVKVIADSTKKFFASLNISNEKLKSVFNNGVINTNKSSENAITDQYKNKVYDWNLIKDSDYLKPVDGQISSGFGSRINPLTNENEFHEGIDISSKAGTDIKTIGNGKVIEAKYSASLGNYVKIQHDNDITSLYAHASEINVKENQEVKKGQNIAKIGSTGNSTGTHLHIELRKGELLINPEYLLKYKDITVAK